MNDVAIVDIDILTALGNLDETWNGLLRNQSGLKKINNNLLVADTYYGVVPSIGDDSKSLGRMHQLLDIALDNLFLPNGSSIVLSTTKGAVDELLHHSDSSSLKCQPWNIEDYVKQKIGRNTPVTTISAACASGTLAIIHAAMRIASGESKFVYVIGIDVLSKFVAVGFDKLKALSRAKCKPFDRNRDGLTLGEGFGVVLLASAKDAKDFNMKPLAYVSGWGASCDASHITAPSRTAEGLINAIGQSIKMYGKQIGGVNAHGTGTNYNDAMELYAFKNIWDEIPPVHSVKGALGHCLGATGVIETAIAVKSLGKNVIPPTVGLVNPEKRFLDNLVVEHSCELRYPAILKCNSGFGGINAAVVLER